MATNLRGNSSVSAPDNGALMLFVPDAPVNLLNNALITGPSTIGFTWS